VPGMRDVGRKGQLCGSCSRYCWSGMDSGNDNSKFKQRSSRLTQL
jgi:hypothetical protein